MLYLPKDFKEFLNSSGLDEILCPVPSITVDQEPLLKFKLIKKYRIPHGINADQLMTLIQYCVCHDLTFWIMFDLFNIGIPDKPLNHKLEAFA